MKRIGVAFALAFVALNLAVGITMAESDIRELHIEDDCDEATFPPEAGCVKKGGVDFNMFLEKLNPKDFGHGAWRNHFDRKHIDEHEVIRAVNVGGEPHSFTKVVAFGGGCVDVLNKPLGLIPVQECERLGAELIPPKTSRDFKGSTMGIGQHKFQCLIHPWMRSEIEVRPKKS